MPLAFHWIINGVEVSADDAGLGVLHVKRVNTRPRQSIDGEEEDDVDGVDVEYTDEDGRSTSAAILVKTKFRLTFEFPVNARIMSEHLMLVQQRITCSIPLHYSTYLNFLANLRFFPVATSFQ